MVESSTSTSLQLSNPLYNKVKAAALVVLPLIGTLYFALAQIWGLPNAEQVLGTTTALTLFLGGTAQLSSRSYNKDTNSVVGEIVIQPTEAGGKTFILALNDGPENLESKSEVRLKIDNQL